IGLVTVALMPLLAASARCLPQSNNRALSYVTAIPRAVTITAPIDAPAPVNQARAAAGTPAPGKSSFARASTRSFIWAMIFWVWLTGVLISLIRLWRQMAGLRRLRANAQPVSPVELDCADCESELLIANVGLGLSAEINSPVLIGVRRPIILLPDDIADW